MLFGKKNDRSESSLEVKEKSNPKVSQEIMFFANNLDIKAGFKPGRTKRVADIALEMTRRLHKDDAMQEKIYRLAFIFDCGMAYVPDEILRKKESLTDDELKLLRDKVIAAGEEAFVLTDYPDAKEIFLAHYERYDGKGYPGKLEEKEIPIETRILQIAEAYVSMTSRRPYHDIFTKGKARGEIIANKVSQFDPVAADALIEMIDEDIDYRLKEE